MPTVHKGFTLVEVVIVIAILGILSAVAIPSYSKLQEQSSAKICAANRSSLEMKLESKVALSNAGSLEQAFNAKSASYAKDYQCPSGGKYSVEDNNAVTCDVHKPDPSAILRKQMNVIKEDKNVNNNSDWKAAINALTTSGLTAFESVYGNAIVDTYLKGQTTSAINNFNKQNLTWKPAKFIIDGVPYWFMIATPNTNDDLALKGTSSYDRSAYLIFDGEHYYGHFAQYGHTVAGNYLSDNGGGNNTKIYKEASSPPDYKCDLGGSGTWERLDK